MTMNNLAQDMPWGYSLVLKRKSNIIYCLKKENVIE